MNAINTASGNEIAMSDNGKSITLTDSEGKNTVTLDGNKGLQLDSDGEISISAGKDLKIQAQNITVTGDKKIVYDATDQLTLKSGNANTVLKKNGNIQLKGNKINIEASGNLKLKGSKIAQN